MTNRRKAIWTLEETANVARWQTRSEGRYTCPRGSDHVPLVAGNTGLYCPTCGYVQTNVLLEIVDGTLLKQEPYLAYAPWTPEQVQNLQIWQNRSDVHPYTCGNDSRHHPLIATTAGWYCPTCNYRQTHALSLIANSPLPPVRVDIPES